MSKDSSSHNNTTERSFINRFSRLILGLFLYAIAIALTIQANIGYMSWEVFAAGVTQQTGIPIGLASTIIGVVVVILAIFLGETIGLGTILNMTLIGIFLDIILNMQIIPLMNELIPSLLMMVLGFFAVANATYLYIGSGFGAGPRDSLMVAVARKTNLPIGGCRSTVEFIVAITGWLLGGQIGWGTLFAAIIVGIMIQYVFKFYRFDPKQVRHESLRETIERFRK